MAQNQPEGVVGIMDQLWFQRGVLSSGPASASVISFKSFDGSPFPLFPKYPSCPSQTTLFSTPLEDEDCFSALPPLADEEFSSEYTTSSTSILEGEDSDELEETKQKEGEGHERCREMRGSSTERVMKKSMSCKNAGELELEEIKGFMDLGFTFREEHLSPQTMSLVPGLKRFEFFRKKERTSKLNEGGGGEGEEDKLRPYLSEAWIIKRPNSPLLSLRVPKLSSDADMKKHLKFWAKTVATEIQEVS